MARSAAAFVDIVSAIVFRSTQGETHQPQRRRDDFYYRLMGG
jgi:hypothetical protein